MGAPKIGRPRKVLGEDREAARGPARPDSGRSYDATTEWRCAVGTCDRGGLLRDGRRTAVGFFRHVCYGHGGQRDTAKPPVTFDACREHEQQFRREHGVDSPPEWLGREQFEADYRRSQRLAASGPLAQGTKISSS